MRGLLALLDGEGNLQVLFFRRVLPVSRESAEHDGRSGWLPAGDGSIGEASG